MMRLIFILCLLLTTSCYGAWWNFFGVSGYTESVSAQFDLTDSERVNFGNILDYDAEAMSIAAWIKTTDAATTHIFGNMNDSVVGWGMRIANGLIGIQFYSNKYEYTYTGTQYSDGNWHHIVVTFDGNYGNDASYETYANGSHVTETRVNNGTPGSTSNAEGFGVGASQRTGASYWTGTLSSVFVIPKVLNSTEVTEIYNGGQSFDYSTASFWSAYKANSKTFWVNFEADDLEAANGVVDLSDNGYQGTGQNLTNSTDLVSDVPP
jgi:hypothetical protein